MQRISNLFPWAQRSRAGGPPNQAHMTFGKRSSSRSITHARTVLKEQLWIWPILAVVILALVGYGINRGIKETMAQSLASQLQTLVSIETSMVQKWIQIQEGNALALANSQGVRSAALELIAVPGSGSSTAAAAPVVAVTAEALEGAEEILRIRARLDQELQPGLSSQGFCGYILASRSMEILASSNPELIGQIQPQYEAALTRALDGESSVTTPFASAILMKDEGGKLRTGLPTMLACAPIRDQSLRVVAVLAMRIRPDREFTKILQLGQTGATGETYAFDKEGLLVSGSRFDEQLILLGLLPDTDHAQSILSISLRDPGGDLQNGYRAKVRRSELPLSHSVAEAIEGRSGVDVEGYRDYRGATVVGAWQWLPNVAMGVTTEIEYDEAYRPLTILRRTFFALFGLLVLSSIAIFAFTLSVARFRREAQKAAIEARQLGQYQLLQQIGSGAMGVVYKGQHAMMRRATAIKLLNVENVNESSIQRFEREVQLTCKLNHPSTIAIYDFGRTPEGVFYYAMEYLEGITLQSLVENYGPISEARAIHILKQVCGSLFEAHSLGLVHRDIKPANIMLNRRGGEADVVKVLDFGLVKAVDEHAQAGKAGGLFGTPLYMSPESIQTPDLVDARSDLYAVGAVGFFLLTGQPVFNTLSLAELCRFHVTAVPTPPSRLVANPISPEIEAAIMACLEKDRSKRPQTARELIHLLMRSPLASSWSIEDADIWWGRHDRSQHSSSPTSGSAAGDLATLDSRASGAHRALPPVPGPGSPAVGHASSAARSSDAPPALASPPQAADSSASQSDAADSASPSARSLSERRVDRTMDF
jgi:serine/threonine protein kinase